MSDSYINITIVTGLKPNYLEKSQAERNGNMPPAEKAKQNISKLRKLKSDFLVELEDAKKDELEKIDEQIEEQMKHLDN